MKQTIKQMNDREHLMLRPAMYIGAVVPESKIDYYFDENQAIQKEYKVANGLLKIINEVIDNSVDVAIKSKFKFANKISIEIDNEKLVVEDNGYGIPIEKNDNGDYLPYICWGCARAGSNFDDKDHTQIGQNGIGSFASNVFSTKFIGETDDGTKSYKIIFTDNAGEYKESIGKSKKQGTKVTCYFDLPRFHLEEITQDHIDMIYQRVLCLANIFTQIKFTFNKKIIKTKNFKDFVNHFDENNIVYDDKNIKFAVLPSSTDEFQHFSYVNGLRINDGGIHIDQISNNIVQGIKEKLSKKYKDIKPGDIKSKLCIVCFISDFPTPKFNSQQKEKLTNSMAEFNQFAKIDYAKTIQQVLKNEIIISKITDYFRIKEEFRKRQELKGLDKPQKKIKSDKYTPPINHENCLLLCEGYSAVSGMLSCLGRNGFGYYELKGKVKNVSENTSIVNNEELSELYKIIKNSMVIEKMNDGAFYELELNGETYIVNENDTIFIEDKVYDVKELLQKIN